MEVIATTVSTMHDKMLLISLANLLNASKKSSTVIFTFYIKEHKTL